MERKIFAIGLSGIQCVVNLLTCVEEFLFVVEECNLFFIFRNSEIRYKLASLEYRLYQRSQSGKNPSPGIAYALTKGICPSGGSSNCQ